MHGANRLGGNALSEAWVYGNLTGVLAAEYARKVKKNKPNIDMETVCMEIDANFNHTNSEHIPCIYNELKSAMWENVGIIREEEKLTHLLKTITGLKAKLHRCMVKGYKDLVRKMELKNMLFVGEAIATSALKRKESRGSHFRADYPDEGGENWIKQIIIRSDDLAV